MGAAGAPAAPDACPGADTDRPAPPVDSRSGARPKVETVRVQPAPSDRSAGPPPQARPWLRPDALLLQRAGGRLQIGTDSRAVVADDPEGDLAAALRRCDGARGWPEIAVARPGGGAQALSRLLTALVDGDLARWQPPALQAVTVRLVGAGTLGATLGRLLLTRSGLALYVVDDDPPDPDLYPLTTAGTQAEAFRARTAADRPGAVRVGRHWSKPEGDAVALTVLAASTAEPDRAVADGLLRGDQPYLVVRALPGGAVVGPLVVPGRTCCLRCTDLTRRDRDAEWPTLLRQLSGHRLRPEPVATAWAAAVGASQVLGFLEGCGGECLSSTVELTGADRRTRWRRWPAHPACGCHW